MIEKIDVMILGGGIAGLGAAQKGRELGRKAVIFEARQRSGGLLDNFEIDGYRFDHAVHLSFASESKVREIFDQASFTTHASDPRCFDRDRWLKHPVQNNLAPLSVEDKVALITSFCDRPLIPANDTYDGWLRHQYGNAISERYPIKYTNKYWATPAQNLSTNWIGNRMRRSAIEEILYGAMSEETPNTYYAKEMRYPDSGGYKAFIAPLINASEIRLNHRVISIDPIKKNVSFANGMIVQYQNLISTLPLPLIVPMIIGVPQSTASAAASLKATSIDLISVAFKRSLVKDLWFYIYDSDILASRAYSPSLKSLDNAPLGTSSLQFEIYSRGDTSRFNSEELKANTLYALKKMGIADESDVKFMDHRFLPYGNVIFDLGMEEKRGIVRNWLSSLNIATCGRFGEWDYLWSNQSFLSGYSAI